MASVRYKELVASVRQLRKLLLPSKFDPTGSYKDALRVETRALSFRILCHAEIETYLEDRTLEIVLTAQQAWEKSRYASAVTLHLIGFSGVNVPLPPDSLTTTDPQKLKTWNKKVEIDSRLVEAMTAYYRRVSKENHGLKEKNLMDLLIPIGFDVSKCDQIFLDQMTTFGESRGAAAHTSGKAGVRRAIDPKAEWDIVLELMDGLKPFDGEFDNLLGSAKAPAAA